MLKIHSKTTVKRLYNFCFKRFIIEDNRCEIIKIIHCSLIKMRFRIMKYFERNSFWNVIYWVFSNLHISVNKTHKNLNFSSTYSDMFEFHILREMQIYTKYYSLFTFFSSFSNVFIWNSYACITKNDQKNIFSLSLQMVDREFSDKFIESIFYV